METFKNAQAEASNKNAGTSEFEKYRWRFGSLQEFLNWYNGRIHRLFWGCFFLE
jgi:hypothetical protein